MENCKTEQKERKWWNNVNFPLVPEWTYKKPEDDWNTTSWSFTWLGLRIWSLDNFGFELGVAIDTHWGIAITAILPYTRIIIGLPCPRTVDQFVYKYLHRKSKSMKELDRN